MCKALACFFVNIFLLANISLADAADLALHVDEMLKLDDLTKVSVQKFKNYSTQNIKSPKILQCYFEVSLLLSWYIKDKPLFEKSVAEIEKHSPKSPILIYRTAENLKDTCSACQGSGLGKLKCLSCKGEGTCTNSLCKEGKVKVKNKDFGEILVDCTICLGTDNCKKCKGEGTVLRNCSKCRTTGMAFSRDKVKELLKDKLSVLKQFLEEKDKVKFEALQKSKGLVKVDGNWITKERLREMEAAKLKAERDAAKLQVNKELKVVEKSGESLLKKMPQEFKLNSTKATSKVKAFIKQHPSSKLVERLSTKLNYLQLLKLAQEHENLGHMSKAVKTLEEALKLEDSQELRERIKHLDNQTIGL